MSTHPTHNMQLTSLMCKFGNYTEAQYNEKFRNNIEKHIIQIHSCMPEGLTDEELGLILKAKLGLDTIDTDLYRPRRCDLSNPRVAKRTKRITRVSILTDSGKTRLNKYERHCIVWCLNEESLVKHMNTHTP